MNEDGTPIVSNAPDAPETPDINSEEGGVTAADVADVLHLSKAKVAEPEKPVEKEPEAPKEEIEEEPEKPAEKPVEPEKPTEPDKPTDTPSFSIEVEDANGVKFTISPDDDLEKVLANFEPKNNGQVIQLMRDLDRMAVDKRTWEAEEETKATDAEKAETVANIQKAWDKEIATLQGQKRIPVAADGKTPEKVDQVFKYMSEENAKRVEKGIALLSSFEDALDKMELNERREADKTAAKAEKEQARKTGSLIGGSSAPASSGFPVYRAGAAKNANQALRVMGLLK